MAEDRFARTAAQVAALQDARAAELAGQVRAFVLPAGTERALDVGCGAGALALALAPLVAEVVGVDRVPELLELARGRAPANATFVEGDATTLPFGGAEFDLAGTLRTLHHVARPELVLAELARVTRPGGRVLVIDQLGPVDPLDAAAVDRFEQARDPGHHRLLPDGDLRQLFEANRLALLRERRDVERRELDGYLDLADCRGEARERARGLAPQGPEAYTAVLGWYLLERR
ncbi:MAG TPA: methyltransferase domain-containing protein [Gaiellaceae bacterium]|nr:methyltransferase domain-containing protein [Gaiellaceae bacterium]